MLVLDVGTGWSEDQPVVAAEHPGIDAVGVDHLERALRGLRGDGALLDDLQFGRGEDAAIEGAERRADRQGLDQHLQAARRPAARDREAQAGIVQPEHRLACALGENLVGCDQGAVDVRKHEGDLSRPFQCTRRHVGFACPMGRQRCPSRAMRSSAALGPSLPTS